MAQEQTTQSAPASIIGALHARYESSMAEYGRIDEAEQRLTESHEDRMLSFRYADAMKVSDSEHDALRSAILYQVPDSWLDAMILLYHIRIQYDLNVMATDKPPEADKLALDTAIDTLFDFMACEVVCDHAAIGAQFIRSTSQVFARRRHRTGMMEG